MKRSPELRDLSEQHHYGLVAARRLRRAAEGETALEAAIAQFMRAWRREIQPHFRHEEEVLLPEFARVVGADDARIVRTLTEHVGLRQAVRELERGHRPEGGPGERQAVLAQAIGLALTDHIRFEERVLFPAVEEAMEGPLLTELGRGLKKDWNS